MSQPGITHHEFAQIHAALLLGDLVFRIPGNFLLVQGKAALFLDQLAHGAQAVLQLAFAVSFRSDASFIEGFDQLVGFVVRLLIEHRGQHRGEPGFLDDQNCGEN